MEGDFDSQFFNKLVNSFKIAFGSPLLQKCVAVNRKRKILNIFVLYFLFFGDNFIYKIDNSGCSI